MPYSLKELRDANGGLGNLSDEQIVKSTYGDYQKYYGTEDEYAKAIGYGGAGRGLTMSRISSGIDSYKSQLYAAGEAVARDAGMDGVADFAARGRKANKDSSDYANARAKDQGGIDDWRDVRGPMSAGNYVGGLITQSAPQMLATATGALAGGLIGGPAGAIAGGVATSLPGNMGDIVNNQIEQTENQPGGYRTDSLSAGLLAIPYTAVDNLTGVGRGITSGFTKLTLSAEKQAAKEAALIAKQKALQASGSDGLNFLDRSLNNIGGGEGVTGRLARAGYSGLKVGAEESAGETFQEFMNQGGRMAVDPNASFTSEDAQKRYIDSAVGGGVMGFVLGGAGSRGRRLGIQPAAAAAPSSNVQAATEGAPPLQLGLDPNVGTSIDGQVNQDPYYVFPDGSTALNSDAALGAANASQLGSRDGRRDARQQGPDNLPGVSQVDGMQNAAGTNSDNVLMNDPGAIEARRQQLERQQRAQDIKDHSDQVAADIESRNQRATVMGLDPKKKAVMELFDQLESAHATGTINDSDLGQGIGQLKVNELGKVRTLFKDIEKKAADKAASDAAVKTAADQGAAADAQTAQNNLAALQPKAPDANTNVAPAPELASGTTAGPTTAATPATAATPQTTAQTDAAPKATAGSVATAAPASSDNVPATQPKPTAAAAVEKATPAERAVTLLDKLEVPHDKPMEVTRRVKGKDTTVKISALQNWTELMSNPQVADRAMKALGIDAQGNQVASPMSFADIGKQEATPVSREAVRKQLARHGINETTINAAVAAPDALDARAGAAFTEAADSTGIVAVPKESDITATDGEVLPQAPRNKLEGSFGRREGTLAQVAGEGLVRGKKETSAEQNARVRGNAILKVGEGAQENKDNSTSEDKRQAAENQKRADERQATILNHPSADEARVDWNEHKQEDSPRYEELTPAVRTAFVLQHFEQAAETGEKVQPMQRLISKFEGQLEDADYTKTGSNPENQGAAARVGAATAESTTGRTDRAGGDTATVQPTTGGQTSSGEAGARSAEPAAQPTVSVKRRRTVERSDAPNSRGVSDAKQLTGELTKFLRVGALGRLVNVVQSVGDLPFAPGVAQSIGINAKTQGFVVDGKAYLIAGNIAPGKGKAVFMHEVGSHLGVQEMLTQGEFKNLVNTVMDWAGGKAGPEAQKIAQAAMVRVVSAKTEAAQYHTELVAYTVEEAINAGYNPMAAGKEGPVKTWMRSVLQQVKNILTKLGVNPDKFSVQDLVDLAYGAAQSVNAAGTQENSGKTQFSQAAEETPQAKAINVSHSAIQSAFKDAWTTAGDLGSSFLKKAAFTVDLVNMAANNGLDTAHAYMKAMNAVQTEKVKLVQEVQGVVEEFGKLTHDEQGQGPQSVNIYLRDSTMEKAWGHVPSWKPNVKTNADMKARYDALSPQAQAVVDRVFKHGDNIRTHLKNAADATVNREFATAIATAEAAKRPEQVAKLKVEQEQALKDSGKGLAGDWPYTPLGRFGDHVVLAMSSRYLQAVKDGNKKLIDELQTDARHYQVERTDTMRSARVLADSLRNNFPDGHVTSFEKGPENNLVYGGRDALGALTRLRHLVRDSASDDLKLDSTASNAIDKNLRDLHLQLLSETSARKSGLSRANIAGANKDMMRTFAGQGQAMAHYIATLRMGADVQDQLQAMKDQAEERTSGDTQRRAYYNELLKRHVMNLEYKPNKAVEAGMALSSVWTLLTNPAHHLTNSMQTAMVTSPQLAGKHGYGKSNAALFTAYHDLGPIIKGGSFKEMDFTKLPKDVQAMAKVLADRGSIGVDQGLELGKFESTPDGKMHVFTKVVEKMRGMAEGVEAVNRLSAAIAAYRLEIKNGATEQAATDYAHKIVLETHGDYSGFNAPRIMRGPVGRLVTQFKKYQLLQLSLYAKLGHQAFNGVTPEERAVAQKTIAFNLAHLAAMGGMTGLPGFALAAWITGKIFGDKDEPEDVEAKLRRAIGDKNLADLLLRGAPKFLGLDTSVKLGLGDILTPLPYSEPGLSKKGYESILLGLSGPLLGGLLPRFADGLGQMSKSIETGRGEDFFKGMEQLMPNGIANTMKAVRYQTNGLTQRNGDTVIQPEDMSILTSMSQALGMPSNTIADKNYLAGQLRASGEFYKQRGIAIKQAYVNAQESNDADGMKESRTDWMRMQGVLREQGYTTQPLSVLLKAPSEKRKREASAVSGVETTKRTRGAVEMLTE